MYVPTPLPFRLVEAESSPEHLAEELLALTKMNWNQTQLGFVRVNGVLAQEVWGAETAGWEFR